MPHAVMLSPHLDDAVFSAGGTAAMLGERGWTVTIATLFSGGTHPASGFALECQRDKKLADTVDYMALRRDEDAAAARALGAATRWCDLPEAPNRGYHDAPALFGPYAEADTVAPALDGAIADTLAAAPVDLVLAPAALGGHVDHRRVLDAVLARGEDMPLAFWRDTPYVLRPNQTDVDVRIAVLPAVALPLGESLARKLDAAACYTSQVPFQFGDEATMREALRSLAEREGGGVAAERFWATPAGIRLLHG